MLFTNVPEDSPLFQSISWKHFITIWNLNSVLEKKIVTKADVLNVNLAIKAYIESFLIFRDHINATHNLNIRVTPKHIWIMSYPRVISHVGSLSSLDTNLGEQKNFQIKQFSQKANQTKNTLKTIAVRESQRFTFSDIKSLCKNVPVPARNVSFHDLSESLQHFCLTNDIHNDNFDFFKNTLYLGYTFRSSDSCAILFLDNRRSSIGLIQTIAYKKNTDNVFFIVKKISLSVVNNLCLRECKIRDIYNIVNIDHIILERPIFLYKCNFHGNVTKIVVSTWCQ